MKTTSPWSKVLSRAPVGALAALLLGGCPRAEPEVWCGALDVHEEFFIPTTSRPVPQDFPTEQRCAPLVPCGGTAYALVLEPEGRCTVQVDFPTPEQGTVRPGGRCETGRNRIGGPSRDVGFAQGGTVTLRDGQLEADIQWEVEIRGSELSRVGGTQHYMLRKASKSSEPTKVDGEAACREPAPPPGPEDFAPVGGCAPEDFVVRTEAGAERIVRFGDALGATYSPRCLSIAAGQSVVFEGPFSTYSMGPGLPESLSAGAPYNPIGNVFFGTRSEVTFPRPGDYLYSNRPNAARGMKGLIRVR